MKNKIIIIILTLFFATVLAACNDKPAYDMTTVSFEDQTFYYDGSPKSILVTGAVPEGITVTYENNDQIEVGVYDVVANFKGSDDYQPIPSKNAVLTILAREEVELPDLELKNKSQIQTELSNLGFSNIVVEEVFNVATFKGTFIEYRNYNIGQIVNPSDELVVYISTRILPDITKIPVEEIEDYFLRAGIAKENIIGVPQTTGDPEFGLGYYQAEAGDEYTTGLIRYLYNGSEVKLKDLTGYTLPEINDYLRKFDLTSNFFENVDNTKEMETFETYVGYEIGQIIPRGSLISMFIYINDDIDDEKQLFISKHVEASVGNNGLELYNPLDYAINLSEYYLSIFEDGSIKETYNIDLVGTLAAKETYFIASDTSEEDIKTKAHLVSSNLIFDGNDTIQLRKKSNNTYIDTVYNIGNTTFTLADEIFIRRHQITKGSRNFDIRDWAGYVPTFIEVINDHPYQILDHPTFELLEDIFPDYGMTKVKYLSAADGDTIYLESLDPRDPGPYNSNSRLRFLMIDTPETQKQGVDGEPYAEFASNFTKNALSKAAEIYIQSDRSAGTKDTFGRNLGVVWYNSGTVENPEWYLLNYELIYNGLGQTAGIKDLAGNYKLSNVWGNRYMYQWVLEGDLHARENKLGLYSGNYQP